jgi:anti-sigma regulatory factor (Ser/Thr protein kinase)/CBS domain-containing protein
MAAYKGVGSTRLQELAYRIRVGGAMTREVISVGTNTTMQELRELLRERRISGVPVVEKGQVIGVVSVEDLIEWLADCEVGTTVGERMTRHAVVVGQNEPLAAAAAKLQKWGRLPVVGSDGKGLAGVITKGDVVEGLLRALHEDFARKEGENVARLDELLDGLDSPDMGVWLNYPIEGDRIDDGGEVASRLRRSLKALGLHPELIRRTAIVMYEAEMNVIIYAHAGEARIHVDRHGVRIEVEDQGPGIADIDLAMEPGYSTAPDFVRELGFGAGMGLFNIRNCSHTMDLASEVGHGTSLKVTITMEDEL